jgi:hypothetical protein
MRVLIRHVVRRPGGVVERSDQVFDGETLTVGRATDQTISIPNKGLPLEHSEILAKGKHLSIRANPGCVMFVNGEQVDHSRLAPGDLIEIGSHRLMVSDPTDTYEQVILVEPGAEEEDEVPLSSQMVTQLEKTGLGKRKFSWISSVAILVLCLVIPAFGLVNDDLASMLRATPISDGQWDSGPLHASHQAIGDDCSACHGTPFQMVPDEKCVACHAVVEHHVDVAAHKLPDLEETRCASCHKEHNEPTALVRQDQAHCVDCHGDLASSLAGGKSDLRDASDFGEDHPEFRVTMFKPVGAGRDTTWETVRVGLDEKGLREQSNLKFPHAVHLDPKGIRTTFGAVSQAAGNDRVVMVCSDCHRPDPSGAYMETVTMEAHCASCHKLQFDARAPDREVPHGNPDVVVRTLQEFYARLYLLNQVAPVGAPPTRAARRPGSVSLPPEGRSLMLSWAQTQAHEAAADLFERRVCKDCHVVSIKADPAHLSPWQVNPVRLTRVWLPKSFFEHDQHETYDCMRCHGEKVDEGEQKVPFLAATGPTSVQLAVTEAGYAVTSNESGDILLPKVGLCRECHGGEDASDMLASTCIDCHRFHIPGRGVMKPWVAGAGTPEPDSDMQRLKREGL